MTYSGLFGAPWYWELYFPYDCGEKFICDAILAGIRINPQSLQDNLSVPSLGVPGRATGHSTTTCTHAFLHPVFQKSVRIHRYNCMSSLSLSLSLSLSHALYIRKHTRMLARVHVHVQMLRPVPFPVNIYTYVSRLHQHIDRGTCMYVLRHTYIHTYLYIYIHMYVYIHIYTCAHVNVFRCYHSPASSATLRRPLEVVDVFQELKGPRPGARNLLA